MQRIRDGTFMLMVFLAIGLLILATMPPSASSEISGISQKAEIGAGSGDAIQEVVPMCEASYDWPPLSPQAANMMASIVTPAIAISGTSHHEGKKKNIKNPNNSERKIFSARLGGVLQAYSKPYCDPTDRTA